MTTEREPVSRIMFRHAVPSFFFGYILLAVVSLHVEHAYRTGDVPTQLRLALAISLGCGVMTAVFNYLCQRVLRPVVAASLLSNVRAERRRHANISALTGFICGGSTVFLLVSDLGMAISTLLLVTLTCSHIRIFGRNMREMLKPGRYSMWSEIMRLVEIYVNIIASFTLINATLELAHVWNLLPGQQFPFKAGAHLFIDAFYYTVVTMTTLGYGDLTPISAGAKLLATLECIVGYVMFALTVGIITRGVVSADWPEDE